MEPCRTARCCSGRILPCGAPSTNLPAYALARLVLGVPTAPMLLQRPLWEVRRDAALGKGVGLGSRLASVARWQVYKTCCL